MPDLILDDFASLYSSFDGSITELDCGEKCAPYNEYGVPFCCDTGHAIPTAYKMEWDYLRSNTDLWHLWESNDPAETTELQAKAPVGQYLIECLGHQHCQRNFRSITCRAFPFFPYITLENEFLGLSYYWEYEDRCWVINHLYSVTPAYIKEFVKAYDRVFEYFPDELENFRYQSILMRRVFGRQQRAIPIFHRNGNMYEVKPKDGKMILVEPDMLPKYGPYAVAAMMPFPDEN